MPEDKRTTYRVKTDGFHGELFRPKEDKYPGKALICFSGSDRGCEMSKLLAGVFQSQGLTTLAIAYVMEEGLPNQFVGVPIDSLEAATKHMHDMGYEKVGLWGISKGAELALLAGSLLPGLVNAVIQVEKITGPILLISSKMDNMWPSELAAKQIMKRLQEYEFQYLYQHLSYDYGSHLFVPMELRSRKFFKGDRGKNKENGRKARMDSLVKTLEFVSKW